MDRGANLRQALIDGPLDPSRAHKLMLAIAEALAAAHSEGVLHRDLKPENIMLRVTDGLESPVLIDFGIATQTGLEEPAQSTQLAGSLGYVAPERWFGPASPASDIYSLAAVALEMYTGTRYADSSAISESLGSVVPEYLALLIRACLSIDPKERPQSAEEFNSRFTQ